MGLVLATPSSSGPMLHMQQTVKRGTPPPNAGLAGGARCSTSATCSSSPHFF